MPPSDGGSPRGRGASCPATRGAAGDSDRSVEVGGKKRTFIVHVPPSLPAGEAVPVVFAFHGFTMSGKIMSELTAFGALADAEKFIAVFPDGDGATPWNVGKDICGAGTAVAGNADDFGFVEEMLKNVGADQCIDRERVYASGFSMGGYFMHHLACQRPDLVRAVAAHSGGTYKGDCKAKIPVLMMHGTSDWLISESCGQEAHATWVTRNGCQTNVESTPVKGGTCERNVGCAADVAYCRFEKMSHGWAGHEGTYGGGVNYEDATKLAWEFFKSH